MVRTPDGTVAEATCPAGTYAEFTDATWVPAELYTRNVARTLSLFESPVVARNVGVVEST